MDENASRAVFLGVSVFVAIVTLTLILTFYRSAKESAAFANRYDVSSEYNKTVTDVLEKSMINGVELRYLLNYYVENDDYEIIIYNGEDADGNPIRLELDAANFWNVNYQEVLDLQIRPNYNYSLEVEEVVNKIKIIAVFKY